MKSQQLSWLFSRRYGIIVGLLWSVMFSLHAAVIHYTPDDTSIFPNPERGFTEEMSRQVSASKKNVIKGQVSTGWFTDGEQANMRLLMVLYNFKNFKSQDLPEAVLTGFDEDMAVLRQNGWKCVLRFAYTETQSDKRDATPAWVQRHLEQLHPHLVDNADVIYVMEAGFIGSWGEWYYTSNYGNESQHLNANRRLVIDALYANAPTDRCILFRYPMTKTEYFDDTTPLNATSAFDGSIRARMGHHNDAFLHDWGNMGTYASDDSEDDPAVRQYIATETLYVPNGGETNIDDDDALAESRYVTAPAEMSTYHWSFCGRSYAEPVTNRWRSSGLFDTLNIHMGYRYQLLSATLPEQAVSGQSMAITLYIRNTGYAPLYNERPVYLVLRNTMASFPIRLQTDPRRWLPNGVVTAISEQVAIPDTVPEGTYQLYLYLPDAYASIAADPRYAVRLANVGVWDAETGMNDLGANLVVNVSSIPSSVRTVTEGQVSLPRKIMDKGTLYILMPDGRRFSILGQ